jgi:hypothetical protein
VADRVWSYRKEPLMLHAVAQHYTHLGRSPYTARRLNIHLLRLLKQGIKRSPACLRPRFTQPNQPADSPLAQFSQVWMTLPPARRGAALEHLIQAIDARSGRDQLLATLAEALKQADSWPLAKMNHSYSAAEVYQQF